MFGKDDENGDKLNDGQGWRKEEHMLRTFLFEELLTQRFIRISSDKNENDVWDDIIVELDVTEKQWELLSWAHSRPMDGPLNYIPHL